MSDRESRQYTETISPEDRPSAESPIALLAPGSALGERYRIEKVLGVGGSAVVYAAFDGVIKKRVALKVVRADKLTPATLTRFRREVRVARDVQSAYLGRVFDLEQSGDSIFLSLELIEGESLRDLIERGPLPTSETVRITHAICQGLQELHRLGIVHRDVKPGNVLIGESGQVKLVDFGLARRATADESRATENEAVVGTVEYLSPEQALGQEVDARTDLYSLGVLMFEMITGRLPHEGRSSLGTLLAQVNEKAPNLRTIRRDTPPWLAAIVAKLLEKKRDQRYASVDELLRDFDRQKGPRTAVVKFASAAAVALIILSAAGFFGYRMFERHRSVRITRFGTSGMAALDYKGHILWSSPSMAPFYRSTVATLAGYGKVVVGIEDTTMYQDPVKSHRLDIYDLRTGKVLSHIQLPSTTWSAFRQYSDTYCVAAVFASDLNEDGSDEVIVTFVHVPYWPSYTVIYDVVTHHSFPVLLASGHQSIAGAEDLDGDGRKELIFIGPNNRMGWYSGLAAVRPGIQPGQEIPESAAAASTPDATYYGSSPGATLWYALLPSGGNVANLKIDSGSRTMSLSYITGRTVTVRFDGFTESSGDAAERNRQRFAAYKHLRDAVRLTEEKFYSDAIASCDLALSAARDASDPILLEWISRNRARTLLQSGNYQAADAEFSRLAAASTDTAEICWDAALAFHLRNRLDDALRWYRRGLSVNADPHAGRLKYEYLQGSLMILAEQKKFAEAIREIDRFTKAIPEEAESGAWFRAGISWMATGTPEAHPAASSAAGDLFPYWSVEFRLTEGARPQELLPRVDELLKIASGNKALLLTLKGELLRRTGDLEAAERVRREAGLQFESGIATDTLLRGHAQLIRKRFADLDRDLAAAHGPAAQGRS